MSPSRFEEILGYAGHSYIEVFSVPKSGWWNYQILMYRTLASYCDIRKPLYKIANWIYRKWQFIMLRTKEIPSYPIYGGSVYCSLTNEAVKEILSSDVAVDLHSRLKDSFCSEEIFFQTVLMNSRLKTKLCNNNLRYIDWKVKSPPKTLTEDDMLKIRNGNKLFCRKIDSVKSATLLHNLERMITG